MSLVELGSLMDSILDTIQAVEKRLMERIESVKVEAIVKSAGTPVADLDQFAALHKQIEMLESRVARQETKPSLMYRGVHSSTHSYVEGDACTYQGSLWVCKTGHAGSTPGVHAGFWQLAVKRGRDAKDVR